MNKRLIPILLIVGCVFAQDNASSKIRFDPETGEIINPDSLEIHNSYQIIFDPYTGEQIIQKSIQNHERIHNEVDVIKINESDFLKKYKYSAHSILFFYPVFSIIIKNENNEVIGSEGFSPILLGYYEKTYYVPLKTNSWNNYWHWGTLAFIIPYVGIGSDYINDNGFYFGIGSIYHVPTISIGKYF